MWNFQVKSQPRGLALSRRIASRGIGDEVLTTPIAEDFNSTLRQFLPST